MSEISTSHQKYEAVIGLEVHSHLKTNTKCFCSCPAEFGAPPNTNICPVCMGHPGVLPVLNEQAVRLLIRAALALNCHINRYSVFARKHYFYPDLPKNFQISQYELPLAENGFVEIMVSDGKMKKIRIKRIHLEEDAGKLLHAVGATELDHSLADYNRAGFPLMEIVTEPDISTPEEAWEYLSSLKSILEYSDVSECNMEEGKFRCDANVSVRLKGETKLGTKTELKNMNSMKGVREALRYEIERQIEILSSGGQIIQETRLWDADTQTTRPMRSKEEAHDYRYFPEPDLPPLEIEDGFIEKIRSELPELPGEKHKRFISEYHLSDYDVSVLTSQKSLADYFEKATSFIPDELKGEESYKLLANWTINEMLGRFNQLKESGGEKLRDYNYQDFMPSEWLAELVQLIRTNVISGKGAKVIFDEAISKDARKKYNSIQEIVKAKNLVQITDESAVADICRQAIEENPKAVAEYKSGKERALGALVGSVMKKSQGRANPSMVNSLLKKLLS